MRVIRQAGYIGEVIFLSLQLLAGGGRRVGRRMGKRTHITGSFHGDAAGKVERSWHVCRARGVVLDCAAHTNIHAQTQTDTHTHIYQTRQESREGEREEPVSFLFKRGLFLSLFFSFSLPLSMGTEHYAWPTHTRQFYGFY